MQLLQRLSTDRLQEFDDKHTPRKKASGGYFNPYKGLTMQLKRKKDRHSFLNRQFEIGLISDGNFVGEVILFEYKKKF